MANGPSTVASELGQPVSSAHHLERELEERIAESLIRVARAPFLQSALYLLPIHIMANISLSWLLLSLIIGVICLSGTAAGSEWTQQSSDPSAPLWRFNPNLSPSSPAFFANSDYERRQLKPHQRDLLALPKRADDAFPIHVTLYVPL